MDNRRQLDILLKNTDTDSRACIDRAYDYARLAAGVENVVAVVSDMTQGTSRIFSGGFGSLLGIDGYENENSIWETRILSLMTEEEQERKLIAELRFFHFLRHLPKGKKRNWYLMSRLRFNLPGGQRMEVLHRMYYVYDREGEKIVGAICLYGPMPFDFRGESYAVDSVTGIKEEIAVSSNNGVLSRRQCQILSLIESGLSSDRIAEQLHISRNTVSRHRQEILARLQVRNSLEACRLAKSMQLI